MNWNLKELLRESVRSLGASALMLFFAALTIIGGVGFLSASQAHELVQQETTLREAGSLVWSARPVPDQNAQFVQGLSASVCQELGSGAGVEASGGLMLRSDPETAAILPGGNLLPVQRVIPGTLRVWHPSAIEHPVSVGSQLVDLGLARQGLLFESSLASGEQIVIDQNLDPVFPVSSLAASIVVLDPSVQQLQECWIRMSPGSAEQGSRILDYAFGGQANITRYSIPDSVLLSPADQWQRFLSWQLWLLAGVAVVLVAAGVSFFARAKFAIYRIFGSNSFEVALIVSIGQWIVVTAATVVATAIALLVIALGGSAEAQVFVLTTAAAYAVAAGLLLPANYLALRGNPLKQFRGD